MAPRSNEVTMVALLLPAAYWCIDPSNLFPPHHWITPVIVFLITSVLAAVSGSITAIVFLGTCYFVDRFSGFTKSADFTLLFILAMGTIAWLWRVYRKKIKPARGPKEPVSEFYRFCFFFKSLQPHPIRRGLLIALLIPCILAVSCRLFSPRPVFTKRDTGTADTAYAGKRVALALSGGGYRAALMHAGVIDALNRYGVRIDSIASVSGGSIIASYYARGGRPVDFVDIVTSGRMDLERHFIDIQNIPALGIVIPGSWRRRVQESVLDREVTENLKMSDVQANGLPVMYGTTDLVSGNVVGISSAGILRQMMTTPINPPGFYKNISPDGSDVCDKASKRLAWDKRGNEEWPRGVPLSQIVAASGAFPAAFEPLNTKEFHLVDGGVSDNTGLTLLLDANFLSHFCPAIGTPDLDQWSSDLILSSNAGKPYAASNWSEGVFSDLSRSVDTLYARTGLRPIYADEGEYRQYAPPAIRLDPGDVRISHAELEFCPIAARISKLSNDDFNMLMRLFIEKPGSYDPFGQDAAKYALPTIDESEEERRRRLDGFLLFLHGELGRDIMAFDDASTLSSRYTPEDAARLYKLGWILVAANIDIIRDQLKNPGQPVSFEVNPQDPC